MWRSLELFALFLMSSFGGDSFRARISSGRIGRAGTVKGSMINSSRYAHRERSLMVRPLGGATPSACGQSVGCCHREIIGLLRRKSLLASPEHAEALRLKNTRVAGSSVPSMVHTPSMFLLRIAGVQTRRFDHV